MNQKALQILEFDKIIQLLAKQATSSAGREKCLALLPSSDPEEIRQAQQETGDALTRIYQKGSLSFSGLSNPEGSLKRLEIGAALSSRELLDLCGL